MSYASDVHVSCFEVILMFFVENKSKPNMIFFALHFLFHLHLFPLFPYIKPLFPLNVNLIFNPFLLFLSVILLAFTLAFSLPPGVAIWKPLRPLFLSPQTFQQCLQLSLSSQQPLAPSFSFLLPPLLPFYLSPVFDVLISIIFRVCLQRSCDNWPHVICSLSDNSVRLYQHLKVLCHIYILPFSCH